MESDKKISIYDLKNCKNYKSKFFKNKKLVFLHHKKFRIFSISLIKSYCDQYIKILIESKIDKSKINKIILSGGIRKNF